MSLLGRNTLRLASAIRLSSMASTSVAVPKFASFVQVEQPKRTMANWMNWLPDNVKGFAFSKQGYNQYGLYHDDLYIEDEEDVQEALRRLPPQLLDERAFRAQRALHYAMLRTVLPKEDWVSYEDDKKNGYYLKPYYDEVVKERHEREAWDKL